MPKSGIERVRAWRRDSRISAARLGAIIGKSGSLVLKMETGVEPVTLSVGLALSKATGVPLAALLESELKRDVMKASREIA